MNPRAQFERNSENNPEIEKRELAPKLYRPAVDSWFQRRLVHVRMELKKEMQTKITRLAKDH